MFNKLKHLVGIETRLEKSLTSVAAAVALPPVNGIAAIIDWMEHHAAAMAREHETLEIFRAIDGDLRKILEATMAAMVEAQFNHTRLNLLLQQAIPYCERIQIEYSNAIRREAEILAKQSSNTPLIQACVANWLHWVGRTHVLRFVRQPRNDELPWHEIRPVTEYALKLNGGIAAKLSGPDGEAGRLQKQLSHLVLLSRTLTPDLRGRQILVADCIADAVSGFVKVSTTHSEATPFGQNTQAGNSAPTMLSVSAADSGKGLFYGLDKGLLELVALENLITTQNKVPPKVDPYGTLDVAETLTVIRHLKNRWSGRVVKREADRKQVTGKLKIAYEFSVLRQMISLVGHQGSSLKGVYNTVEECEVEDLSATGIGVKLNSRKSWAKIGLLVGLKTERDVNWRIGVIRRVQPVKHTEVQIGVQFLCHDPESVRATMRAKVSDWEKTTELDSYDNKLALYLRPSDLNEQSDMLICARTDLRVGQGYMLPATREGDITVRVTEQVELGPDSVIYRCEKLAVKPVQTNLSDGGLSL